MFGLVCTENVVENGASRVGIKEDLVTDSSVVGSNPGTAVLVFEEELLDDWWLIVV